MPGLKRRWRLEVEGRLQWLTPDPAPGSTATTSKLLLAKMPCRVKSITDTWKERRFKSKQALGPAACDCSAGSAGLIHITCRSLFEASTAAARLCMGSLALLSRPLGLACLSHTQTHTHKGPVKQIHRLSLYSFSLHLSGFQNKYLRTSLSTFKMVHGPKNSQGTFTFNLLKC